MLIIYLQQSREYNEGVSYEYNSSIPKFQGEEENSRGCSPKSSRGQCPNSNDFSCEFL